MPDQEYVDKTTGAGKWRQIIEVDDRNLMKQISAAVVEKLQEAGNVAA
jgi:hypothetical protein